MALRNCNSHPQWINLKKEWELNVNMNRTISKYDFSTNQSYRESLFYVFKSGESLLNIYNLYMTVNGRNCK